MKIYRCDWCEKDDACSMMAIEGRNYDVCSNCRTEIQKKLGGKGEPIGALPGVTFVPVPCYPAPILMPVSLPLIYNPQPCMFCGKYNCWEAHISFRLPEQAGFSITQSTPTSSPWPIYSVSPDALGPIESGGSWC